MARIEFEVDTHEYEFAHGRKPRGAGAWAIRAEVSSRAAWERQILWHTGTLKDALANARKTIRAAFPGAEYVRLVVLS